MSRRPASTRFVSAVVGPVTAVLVALAGLVGPADASAAPADSTVASRATAPAYGPWSDYYQDVRARVATPTRQQNRAYVQVNRKRGVSGDRQFRLSWHATGTPMPARVGGSKLVAQGSTITLRTAALPCGRTRVTLMGRSRAAGGSYGAWKSVSAVLTRAC